MTFVLLRNLTSTLPLIPIDTQFYLHTPTVSGAAGIKSYIFNHTTRRARALTIFRRPQRERDEAAGSSTHKKKRAEHFYRTIKGEESRFVRREEFYLKVQLLGLQIKELDGIKYMQQVQMDVFYCICIKQEAMGQL